MFPSAVLDTGVPLILAMSRIANAIYGAVGVTPAEDGMCESSFLLFSLLLCLGFGRWLFGSFGSTSVHVSVGVVGRMRGREFVFRLSWACIFHLLIVALSFPSFPCSHPIVFISAALTLPLIRFRSL